MKKILFTLLLIALVFGNYANAQSEKKGYQTRRKLTKEEDEKLWTELIPKLGTGSEFSMKEARQEVVKIGLPVVVHLVSTFNVGNLMVKLDKKDKLMLLQSNIIDDIREWYQKVYEQHASGETLGKIKLLIDGSKSDDLGGVTSLVNCRSSKQILNTVKKIWDTIRDYNKKAKEDKNPILPELQIFSKLRGQAALAIGEIGDMTAAEEVAELVSDDSMYVKMKVLESLGLMGPLVWESVCKKIYPYLFHKNYKLRTYAWTALRKLDFRMAIAKLVEKFEEIEKDYKAEKMTTADYLDMKKKIVDALTGITLKGFSENLNEWKSWMKENSENDNPLDLENKRSVKGFRSDGS